MTRNRRALGGISACLAAAGLALATYESEAAAQADEAAVRRVLEQFTDAWNRGNATGAAATFTGDGVLIAGDGTQSRGRAHIEQYLTPLFAKQTRFTSAVTGLCFLGADVALLQSEGGFLLAGETTVAPERRGVHSIVMVRDGDNWRVALAQRTRILAYVTPSGR